MKKNITAIVYAVMAAVFYSLNVPCSKLLLNHIPPTMLAGFLYLGAGAGVGIMYLFHYKTELPIERLNKQDLPYTVGMVLLDIVAPILLMIGVNIGTSSNATLLGNFEIVATSIIAFAVFKEKISRKLWVAIILITVSSIILSFDGSEIFNFSVGSLFVIGATVCWGLENNCTRSISEKSTYQIVTIKGLCSGCGSFIISLAKGEYIVITRYIVFSFLLGYIAYGLSIFAYIRAQKTLGAAKTSSYYAIAPFVGAFLSFVLLKEKLSLYYAVALITMIFGTAFVVADTLLYQHNHKHSHTFTHSHNGSTHTHTVSHRHSHDHYIHVNNHSHRHCVTDLEKLL